MTLSFLFLNPRFDTNDDSLMILGHTGQSVFGGEPTELIYCLSILLGSLLKFLYQAIPLPWYSILIYAHIFFSMWIVATLIRSNTSAGSLLIFSMFSLSFFTWVILRPTYTLVSIILAGLSTAFFFEALFTDKNPRKKAAIGALLLFALSSMLRTNSARLGYLVMLPFCIFYYYLPNKKIYQIKDLIWSGIPLVINVLLDLTHLLFIYLNPKHYAFESYRFLIAQIHDFKLSSLSSRGILTAAGWTDNDILLFKNWYSFHPVLHSIDRLEWINNQHSTLDSLRLQLGNLISNGYEIIELLITFLLVSIFYFKKGSRSFAFSFTLMLSMLAQLFLTTVGRAPPWRVEYGLIVLVITSMLISISSLNDTARKNLFIGLASIVLGVFFYIQLPSIRTFSDNNKSRETQLASDLARLNPHENELYFAYGEDFNFEDFTHPFREKVTSPINLFWVAIPGHHPNSISLLERFRVKEPFSDWSGRKDIHLIAIEEKIPAIIKFYEERHGIKVNLIKTFEGRSWNSYSLVKP